MNEVIIIGIGAVCILVSFVSWWQEKRPVNMLRTVDETGGIKFRAVVFGLWTLLVPLYFWGEWYLGSVDLGKLSYFQYRNKVTSDLWTAVALVLGVLFGIKKF